MKIQMRGTDSNCAVTARSVLFLLFAATLNIRSAETLTFNKEVAPILSQHCATCHRPGQSAPFNLLSFSDVKKRARQVAEVVQKRFMPPWLPEKGYGEFAGDRSLSARQIKLIEQWVAEGAEEGAAADLPQGRRATAGDSRERRDCSRVAPYLQG